MICNGPPSSRPGVGLNFLDEIKKIKRPLSYANAVIHLCQGDFQEVWPLP